MSQSDLEKLVKSDPNIHSFIHTTKNQRRPLKWEVVKTRMRQVVGWEREYPGHEELYSSEAWNIVLREIRMFVKVKNQPPDLTAGEFNRGE